MKAGVLSERAGGVGGEDEISMIFLVRKRVMGGCFYSMLRTRPYSAPKQQLRL